ncbi:hypothetical protein PRIPAC_75601 [Pristionchus pacificus]|uniref:G protein-coupled receptor n=1 Tax=Pristionchus pacificus TaxID=54126 RepID=A0A8R1YQG9_PRIPA|nr:hypothetical protein PRIPAC_75601 [Pristionchus pacificus]|eukprot:PDM74430.1 G protein-coupled receptor [Pristionchus pacificus]
MGIISNLTALYLICIKSRKNVCEYRKLLLLFLISDLFYAILQGALEPSIIVSGDMFMIFASGFFQNNVMLSVYCGCVSMSFVIISFHFVFRALAMSNKSYVVSHLDWKKLSLICLIFLAVSGIWGGLTYTQFSYLPSYERLARNYFDSINLTFPKDPARELIIFQAHFERRLFISHTLSPRLDGSIAMNILLTILFVEVLVGTFVFAVIVSCIYIMRCLSSVGRNSEAWKNHHRHLFVALLVQFLIPLILLYIPCTVFILVPVFGISSSFTTPTWLLSGVYSIYPILDPLAIILLINDYRRALKEMGKTLITKVNSLQHLKLPSSRSR